MERKRKRMLFSGLIILFLAGGITSCGPVQYATTVLDADAAIEAAKNVRAWQYACFEYYAAVHYMTKAMEEAGYSDYEAATDMATKSLNYAKRARSLTMRRVPPVIICKGPKTMKRRYKPKKKKKPKAF